MCIRDRQRRAAMNKVVTIGVYGFDAETFFTALQRAGVDTPVSYTHLTLPTSDLV